MAQQLNDVFVSSMLVKRNLKLKEVIRIIDNALRELCKKSSFYLICNDVITVDHLWNYGLNFNPSSVERGEVGGCTPHTPHQSSPHTPTGQKFSIFPERIAMFS